MMKNRALSISVYILAVLALIGVVYYVTLPPISIYSAEFWSFFFFLDAVVFVSYWVIGFPLACILIRTDWLVPALGAMGAWVSFVVALTITAGLLSWRFVYARRLVFEKNAG